MSSNKKHYYDGKLYALLIDPVLREIRDIITEFIQADSSVVDIGCGTGSLTFSLASYCKSIVGVELSSKMFEYANAYKNSHNITNATFIHQDATNLFSLHDRQFDYAIISMALHEMSPDIRVKVIYEAKRIAQKVVIADYIALKRFSIYGMWAYVVEFLAGFDHFKNFKDFQHTSGIDKLLHDSQLHIIGEKINMHNTIKVLVAN